MKPSDYASEAEQGRLWSAVEASSRALMPFRKQRLDIIKQVGGAHYGVGPAMQRVPINHLEMAISIYQRVLVPSRPQALVTTWIPGLRPAAVETEIALNRSLLDLDFETSCRRAVMNALYGIGVVKVGVAAGKAVTQGDETLELGEMFVDPISMDDWVHDMGAQTWAECQFYGNFYRVDAAAAAKLPWYKGAQVVPDTHRDTTNVSGDPKSVNISKSGSWEDFRPSCQLLDLYIPSDNVIATFYVQKNSGKLVDVREWQGPRSSTGPYELLSFEELPDNATPLPPAALWVDLHEIANSIYRKLANQAERQKDVLTVVQGQEGDGERAAKAHDGDMIPVGRQDAVQTLKMGGADQVGLAFFLQTQLLADMAAGNVSLLAGLGTNSPTATQDQILSTNANRRVQEMQQRTMSFIRRIITKHIAWYLWTEPIVYMPLVKTVPGTDIEIPFTYTADSRQGDFFDYNYDLDVFSLQDQTPQTKATQLLSLWERFLVPMAPLLQAQGKQLDVDAMTRLLARYYNMPEIEEVVIDTMLPPEAAGGAGPNGRQPTDGASPALPQNTTRRYIREGLPAPNAAAQMQQQTMGLMMGGKASGGASGPLMRDNKAR